MARTGEVIENPGSGERMTFLVTAGDSGGALLRCEYALRPGGWGPLLHVHPVQEESFEVLAGTARFRIGRQERTATAGERLVVPPHTAHNFANAGDDELRLRIELRPALRMERTFESIFALARAGRVSRKGFPHALDAALIARECPDVAYAARLPVGLQKVGIAALAAVARSLGRRIPADG